MYTDLYKNVDAYNIRTRELETSYHEIETRELKHASCMLSVRRACIHTTILLI